MKTRITDSELLRCVEACKDTLVNFAGRPIDLGQGSASLTRDAIADLERLIPAITSFKENASLLSSPARAISAASPSQEVLCEHHGLIDKVQRDGGLLARVLANMFSRYDCLGACFLGSECEVFTVFFA
jgi:hypothetical protein